MNQFVRKFSRKELEFYKEPIRNTIIVPKFLNNILETISYDKRESTGILFVTRQNFKNIILWIGSFIILTGRGSAYAVNKDEKKRLLLNDWLNKHQEYSFVEFHTHCISTGEDFFDKFSNGDFNTFSNIISTYPKYKHILSTPTHLLTFSKELYDIIVTTNDTKEVEENQIKFKKELQAIYNS